MQMYYNWLFIALESKIYICGQLLRINYAASLPLFLQSKLVGAQIVFIRQVLAGGSRSINHKFIVITPKLLGPQWNQSKVTESATLYLL